MLEKLSGETRLFPIIGDPISFVRIVPLLTRDFESQGHNAICIPMQVPEGKLDVTMKSLAIMGNVDGVLVTMPHKTKTFSYCATTSERSKMLGVVSTIRRNSDGTWHGDIFDGVSFVNAQITHGARPHEARALLVGAGGAGSAIAIALLEAGVRDLIVHDADKVRSAKLINLLSALGRGHVAEGSADPTGFDMVCNATPMGMAYGDPLPISAALLTSSMFVGDVIAGHGVTPLLQAAQAAGCKTANGDQMVDAVRQLTLKFLLGR